MLFPLLVEPRIRTPRGRQFAFSIPAVCAATVRAPAQVLDAELEALRDGKTLPYIMYDAFDKVGGWQSSPEGRP